MTKKITKKEMLTMIMALDEVKANADMVEFLEHEIELLNKKASSKKPKKETEKNTLLIEKILAVLCSADKPLLVSEIQKFDDDLQEISNQKATALVLSLYRDGKVTKTIEKRKSYFSIVNNTDTEEE